MEEIPNLYRVKNVVGWFLSRCDPAAEEKISKLLPILDSQHFRKHEHNFKLQHFAAHIHGVKLLCPRNEKLLFDGAGRTKYLSATNSELPFKPMQGEAWKNALKHLVGNIGCVTNHES